MNRLIVTALCAGMVYAGGTGAVRAQEVAAGGAATLERQKSEAAKELKAVEQKLAEREKALSEQPQVAEAKKAATAAEAAYKDFTTNNAEYIKLAKTQAETMAASRKAWDAAVSKDADLPQLRKQINELKAREGEAKTSLRKAAPDAQAALKKEIAGLADQAAALNLKIKEREQALNEQPDVAEAKKAASAAEAAYKEFVKSNAEYIKLLAARNETGAAYKKAMDAAKSADPAFLAFTQEKAAVRARLSEIEKKMGNAKKGN